MHSCVALLFALVGVTAASRATPITRIVTLLNGLKDKLEEDMKAETDLYETYKCWYKTTTTTKAASNDAANSRVDSLKTYIKDVDAGKIEFTTERQDLEKQVGSLKSDLEQAKTMRANEKKDFEAAKAEMQQAVTALDSAIKTIDDGTKGSALQTRSYIDMLSTRHSLQKSMAFARGLLGADDQKVLEEILSDDEPKDWKKLNRKADHKMKYVKSSGKIMKTLKGLRTTFKGNLDDAIKAETEAVATYTKVSGSKGAMLSTATTALTDMAAENGARGVSKQEAQDEVDALEAQVVADTKFITEAEGAFKIKETEWDGRKEMRGKEILAMSQAIAVLASDDAKDQFKTSFSFIQESQGEPQHRRCAARLLRSLAVRSDDARLALLAVSAGNEAIDKVVKKIDEIVVMKNGEEKTDLDKKQKCESDLSDAASKARKASLAIDTATEDITRATSKIEELKGQIKEQNEKKTGLGEQIDQLKRQRADENTQFKNDKLADQNAIALVEKAVSIVKDWKNAKKASFIETEGTPVAAPTAPEGILPAPAAAKVPIADHQAPHRLAATAIKVHTAQKSTAKQAPQFQTEAGAAPVPPPATWDTGESYGGAGGEQKGIVGILELVKADMEKDVKAAEADEKQAVTDFGKAKSDLEGEIKATDTTIDAYTKDKAAQEKTFADKGIERGTKKGELESQTDLYKGFKPGCDFLLVNFDTRTKARTIEVDGLKKAKAILKGAKFGKSAASLLQETC